MAAIEDMVMVCRFLDWLSAKTAMGVSLTESGRIGVSNDDVAGASSGDLPLAHPLLTLSHAFYWAGTRRLQKAKCPMVQ
jgi:hypothetical protein